MTAASERVTWKSMDVARERPIVYLHRPPRPSLGFPGVSTLLVAVCRLLLVCAFHEVLVCGLAVKSVYFCMIKKMDVSLRISGKK